MVLSLSQLRYHLRSFVCQSGIENMSHHNAFVLNDQNEALKSNSREKINRHLALCSYFQYFFALSLGFSVLRVVFSGVLFLSSPQRRGTIAGRGVADLGSSMDFPMGETDLEYQTSAQHSSVPSSSCLNIDYEERAFEPTKGRGYQEYKESLIEPFSSYRNSASIPHPNDDYPNEICQDLNCWQTAPHQHTIEELQCLMDNARSRLEHNSSENKKQVQKQRAARKIAKNPTKLQSSRGLHSWVDNPFRMNRDLRSALPDTSELTAQAANDQSNLAQLFVHKPPNRTFTLALRPALSEQSLVEADEAGIAEPALASSSDIDRANQFCE